MEKSIAKKIVKLRALEQELNVYAEHRLSELSKKLLSVNTIEELKNVQGMVAEVKRLKTLSDEIRKELENE